MMSLFTLEALIRCRMRAEDNGMVNPPDVFFHAYLRWARTQGVRIENYKTHWSREFDGWLVSIKELHEQRDPGRTCLQALKTVERRGTIENPINNSKGCGGVMRAAPAGFFDVNYGSFKLGCDLAAVTYGHPTGYLSGGFLAELIAHIRHGHILLESIFLALVTLKTHDGHEEVSEAVYKAVEYASSPEYREDPHELIEKLGQGWVAEEALPLPFTAH